MLNSSEFIIKQKTASGNYKSLTGIDRLRSYLKIDLSCSAFLRLQMQFDSDEIERN